LSSDSSGRLNQSSPALRSGTAIRLTHDHKSTDPKEISRIESSGGVIIRGRVLGVLAVARSLGDHGLKEFVIGRPYLSSTVVHIVEGEKAKSDVTRSVPGLSNSQLSPPFTDGEFLIVACDGLWDVMEDQEAVYLVRNYVSVTGLKDQRQNQERVASFLCDEALRRGSTDNVTVVVYWL